MHIGAFYFHYKTFIKSLFLYLPVCYYFTYKQQPVLLVFPMIQARKKKQTDPGFRVLNNIIEVLYMVSRFFFSF